MSKENKKQAKMYKKMQKAMNKEVINAVETNQLNTNFIALASIRLLVEKGNFSDPNDRREFLSILKRSSDRFGVIVRIRRDGMYIYGIPVTLPDTFTIFVEKKLQKKGFAVVMQPTAMSVLQISKTANLIMRIAPYDDFKNKGATDLIDVSDKAVYVYMDTDKLVQDQKEFDAFVRRLAFTPRGIIFNTTSSERAIAEDHMRQQKHSDYNNTFDKTDPKSEVFNDQQFVDQFMKSTVDDKAEDHSVQEEAPEVAQEPTEPEVAVPEQPAEEVLEVSESDEPISGEQAESNMDDSSKDVQDTSFRNDFEDYFETAARNICFRLNELYASEGVTWICYRQLKNPVIFVAPSTMDGVGVMDYETAHQIGIPDAVKSTVRSFRNHYPELRINAGIPDISWFGSGICKVIDCGTYTWVGGDVKDRTCRAFSRKEFLECRFNHKTPTGMLRAKRYKSGLYPVIAVESK